jgi:SnoaL-like protein
MASRIEDTVRTYIAAWNENDDARRSELLDACWASGGMVTFPQRELVGREALLAYMGAFRLRCPDQRVVLTSGIDHHHRCFRIEGDAVRADGTIVGKATEVGEVDGEGKIVRVLSFVDPIPRP